MNVHRLCEIASLVCFGCAAIGIPTSVNMVGLGLFFAGLVWWVV